MEVIMPKQIIDITRMRPGETGKVVEILGGHGLIRRLETLGVRLSADITNISSQIGRGPVVVRVGNTQSALGFGMAMKVIVELQTVGGDDAGKTDQ